MVLKREKYVFILVNLASHVVDLILEVLALLIQELCILLGLFGLLLLLRGLDLVLLYVFHELKAILLELDLRSLDGCLLS